MKMKFQLQEIYLKDFFIQNESPELVTIILNDLSEFPLLRDNMGYLAIKLVMKKTQVRYAIIEIPKTMNRFVVLPSEDENNILIDDVIRHNLKSIFNIFDYESVSAHMIKISRDAQLDIDSDLRVCLKKFQQV
jgi:polyphosphate kinase